MTSFGWGLIGVLVFSLYVSYKVYSRTANKKRNPLLLGFLILIMFCINGIIYTLFVNNIENNLSLFVGNKYQAVVVDFEVSKGTTTATGSISKAPREVYYYTAIVEYKDQNDNVVRKRVNIGKDKPPAIGETIIISDKLDENNVNDVSTAQNPIILVSYFFLSLLFSISFFITCYGFGFEKNRNIRITKRMFVICIIVGLSLYTTNFIIAINT